MLAAEMTLLQRIARLVPPPCNMPLPLLSLLQFWVVAHERTMTCSILQNRFIPHSILEQIFIPVNKSWFEFSNLRSYSIFEGTRAILTKTPTNQIKLRYVKRGYHELLIGIEHLITPDSVIDGI